MDSAIPCHAIRVSGWHHLRAAAYAASAPHPQAADWCALLPPKPLRGHWYVGPGRYLLPALHRGSPGQTQTASAA